MLMTCNKHKDLNCTVTYEYSLCEELETHKEPCPLCRAIEKIQTLRKEIIGLEGEIAAMGERDD